MRSASIAGAAVLLLSLGGIANAQLVQITDVTLDNAKLKNGVLTAPTGTVEGTLLGLPFTTDIKHFSLDLTPAQQGTGCPILNLELAPIHLQLLGLHVDTSRICLSITGSDEGLGALLCGLVGPGGLNLGDLLDGLLGTGLLGDILDGVLNGVLDQQPGGGGNGNGNNGNGRVCGGQCEVLHLVLGPLDLTLLGLEVMLDNCHGGPVEVCVSATAREGLLGQLLCGLVNGNLLGGVTLSDIVDFVDAALAALPGGLTADELAILRGILLGL